MYVINIVCAMFGFKMNSVLLLVICSFLSVTNQAEVSEISLENASASDRVAQSLPAMGVDSVTNGGAVDNLLEVSWRLKVGNLNISEECARDTRIMYDSLQNLTLWAFEMWDSSSKQPFGYIHGSTYQLGNFDECIQPHASSIGGIQRQYCLADVSVDVEASNSRRSEFKESFDPYSNVLDKIYYSGDQIRRRRDIIHWAMCVPASCSPMELEMMSNLHFQDISTSNDGSQVFRASINPALCQKADKSSRISTGPIIFFVFFGVLLLIVIAASVRHWYVITTTGGDGESCSRLVQSYSVIRQLQRLGEVDGEGTLDVLYGLKVLSICFIIMDHRLGTTLAGPINNMEYLEGVYRSFEFMFLSHGDLIVDTFLVVSGLLAIHGILKKYSKGPINAPLFILLRFLRLVPAYAVTLLFAATILPITGSGPLWGKIEQDAENCRNYWWTNLLMISNYVHVDQMCMFHSWYIPVDFQLSAVFLCSWAALTSGPRAAKRFCSHRFAAPILAGLLLAVSIILPGLITYILKLPAMLLFHDDFLTNPQAHPIYQIMYVKTHARATPYIIGLITGYLIFKYTEQGVKRMSMLKSSLGGMFGLLLLFTTIGSGYVFYLPTREYSAVESAFYAALYRPVWAAGVCLIVACSVFGRIPIVTKMLSWSPWKPLGKLVYGAYLAHLLMQLRSLTMSRQPVFLDGFAIVGVCLGDIVYSFSISLLLYLTVEAPAKDLMSVLLFPPRVRKSESAQVSQSTTGNSDKELNIESSTEDVSSKVRDGNTITGIFVLNNNNIRTDSDKNIV